MTNKLMTGEEVFEALKAAGWTEKNRVEHIDHDPSDYIFIRMEHAPTDSRIYVRIRSPWTDDETAEMWNKVTVQDWNDLPEDLKWPVEIVEVMKFCS